MKCVLFVVCTLVAIQGLHAEPIDSENTALTEVLTGIKSTLEDITQQLSAFSDEIPEYIQMAKNYLLEVISHIPEMTSTYKEQLQQLSTQTWEVAAKCVSEHKMNSLNILMCVSEQMQPLHDAVVGLGMEVMSTIAVARDSIETAAGEVMHRLEDLQSEVDVK